MMTAMAMMRMIMIKDDGDEVHADAACRAAAAADDLMLCVCFFWLDRSSDATRTAQTSGSLASSAPTQRRTPSL